MCDNEQTEVMISFNILQLWQPCEASRRGRNCDVNGAVMRIVFCEHGEIIMKWKNPLAAFGLLTLGIFAASPAFGGSNKDFRDRAVINFYYIRVIF